MIRVFVEGTDGVPEALVCELVDIHCANRQELLGGRSAMWHGTVRSHAFDLFPGEDPSARFHVVDGRAEPIVFVGCKIVQFGVDVAEVTRLLFVVQYQRCLTHERWASEQQAVQL